MVPFVLFCILSLLFTKSECLRTGVWAVERLQGPWTMSGGGPFGYLPHAPTQTSGPRPAPCLGLYIAEQWGSGQGVPVGGGAVWLEQCRLGLLMSAWRGPQGAPNAKQGCSGLSPACLVLLLFTALLGSLMGTPALPVEVPPRLECLLWPRSPLPSGQAFTQSLCLHTGACWGRRAVGPDKCLFPSLSFMAYHPASPQPNHCPPAGTLGALTACPGEEHATLFCPTHLPSSRSIQSQRAEGLGWRLCAHSTWAPQGMGGTCSQPRPGAGTTEAPLGGQAYSLRPYGPPQTPW